MRTLFIVASALILSACGGAPTGPAPVPSSSDVVTSTTPQPAPPVEEPAPLPTPAPAPVPPPAPRGVTFDAEVGVAYWPGQPVFPGHFELTITPDRVEAGAHGYDILSKAPDNVYVIAGTRNVETLTIEYHGPADGSGTWQWTYNGLAGQATGGLVRR